MKILIAEDNLVMAHVLQFNLERAGFDVHAAGDGARREHGSGRQVRGDPLRF